MTPIKWKAYLIVNYSLLIIASIIFLIICALVFGGNVVETNPIPYFMALGFLVMVGQCIINLFIYSKNFPHKKLSRKALTIHIVATVLNFVVFLGLSLVLVVGTIVEFGEDLNSSDQTGKMFLGICFILWVLDGFILFGQLTLARFLKRNNMNLFTTMINSIGNKVDE